ncbi:tyrosine-type recombinase/integrase [Brachymonas denitrificans]|uniref:tyrosine-type recombinase/integrase n=1 Tax=Brachymonas denitrificans TaxID=28220 RepID=UPI002B001FDB|nr:tyrosine-type recombinase/integrase [Brachymonas denitrificans]
MAPPLRTINYVLKDVTIRGAGPKASPYKLADGGGLYLEVMTTGSRFWRYSYRINGKRPRVTLGEYPAMGIKAARDRHEELRKLVADGIDPARKKKIDKVEARARAAQEQTFETFTRTVWIPERLNELTQRSREQTTRWLEGDVFPAIGALALGAVHARDVLELLEGMRNTPTKATNIRGIIERIYQYAAQKLLVTHNPAVSMRGLIAKPAAQHYAPLPDSDVKRFMEAVRDSGAHPGTRLAVELLMLTVVRKANVAQARWEHIDMEAKTWTIPALTSGANGHMKARRSHTVYLSRQAMAVLEKAAELSAHSAWVFPSVQSRHTPMADEAINHLFARLRKDGQIPEGFAPHGLRSTASTAMNEHGITPDVVEMILAHKERNSTRDAYNRAQYAKPAREALQWYADRIDKLVKGLAVVSKAA